MSPFVRFFSYLSLPFILTSVAFTSSASVTEEAEMLMKTGEPAKAVQLLKKIKSEKPKDSSIPMLLGDCYVAMDSNRQAIAAYREAQKKGNNDAWLSLARLAISEYRIQDADEDIELYRKGLKKGRKTLPDNSGELDDILTRTRNMLDRVEKIVIIDSISVDEKDFFKFYKMSRDCGRLSSPSAIPSGFKAADQSVVYNSSDGVEMIWAVENSKMNIGLVSSTQLYGGEWESPTPLGDQLNEGGDANYPFMMSDGVTLYFANDGENSLGGYDIFITRRNSDGVFLQPQNIGMPYNSPFNDYMLAIDEQTGVGWWATDRNRIPGKVTIYTFIPSDMRVNYDVNEPNLAAMARIDSFKDTWPADADFTKLKNRMSRNATESSSQRIGEFLLSIPGKGVYTTFKNFSNPDAAMLMRQYLDDEKLCDELSKRLIDMRERYRNGDTGLSDEIIRTEKDIAKRQKALKALRNKVIKTENL